MTEVGDPPPGVELRDTGGVVVARHEPTGISSHGATAAEAIDWLAEGVALQFGVSPVDDPESFLAAVAAEGCGE